MGGLKNNHLFFTIWRVRKFKFKVSDSMSGEGPLPCLQMTFLFLYLHLSCVSLCNSTNISYEGSAFMT